MVGHDRYTYTAEQLRLALPSARTTADLLRALGLVPAGGNYESVLARIRALGLDATHLQSRRQRAQVDRADGSVLVAAIACSRTKKEALQRMGLPISGANYRALNRRIDELGVPTDHLLGKASNRGRTFRDQRRPIATYLVAGRRVSSAKLRKRLIDEGLKDAACERCRRATWQRRAIPLELDHVNGDRMDNRLENLRVLCPNCHALTPTY